MIDDDMAAKIAAQEERLAARPEPEPAPVLPPRSIEGVFDRRLVIERETSRVEGKPAVTRHKWRVLDSEGHELPAETVAEVLAAAAHMIASSEGWHQDVWRAARTVLTAFATARATAPPPRSG